MHHFYTQLPTVITDRFFQGEEYCTPIYNSDTAASGLMKFVGTIIVHSILQGGTWASCLWPRDLLLFGQREC